MFSSLPILKPQQLHIPDGFLTPPISIFFWIVTIIILAIAVRKTRGELGERQIPLMGIMAAFIFAAQMINFPVAGGTSGHLLGGVLAAITLGPWAGMLVMSAVIGVQALLFQDGGLLVMGANIFNMGLLTALIGYGFYRTVAARPRRTQFLVIGVAAWLSVMGGALMTALQLWLSNTSPLQLVMPAMLGVHAIIGLGEAFVTVAAIAFILQTQPDILSNSQKKSADKGRGWVIGGFVAAAVVAILSPLASANPDGLERVAEDLGFLGAGLDAPYSIIPDYTLPFLGETPFSTILAGLIGVMVVAVLMIGMVNALKAKS